MSLFLFLAAFASAQSEAGRAVVFGKVTDSQGTPMEFVNVTFSEKDGCTTDAKGAYELSIPADTTVVLTYTFIGYSDEKKSVRLTVGARRRVDVHLNESSISLPDAVISDRATEATSLTRLDPRQVTLLPSMSSGVEDLVKTLPGVVSNNELSSQYTVRGGNFDENLVYVNGIEVYRPFLVGSGQQEGLSFVNSHLVSNIEFSAGGFAAEYGDKMSSVLDVTYKRPHAFAGSVTLSMLGADVHVEGSNKNDKFSYLIGARYKNTGLVLRMMNTKGSYRPNFTDVQTLFNYRFNNKWELSFLGYYSRNQYNLVPQTAETSFGYVNLAYRLKIFFEGEEIDNYSTGLGALTLSYTPQKDLNFKLIASAYSAYETERYDILGEYRLGQLEMNLGSEDGGNVIDDHSVGTYLSHARNAFYTQVYNFQHIGSYEISDNVIKWGLRYQHQRVDDAVDEWEMIDSAGYSLPTAFSYPGTMPNVLPELNIDALSRGHNILALNNFDAFIQDTWTYKFDNESEIVLVGGVRANYWDYGRKFYASPRGGIAYKPHLKKNDLVLRLSGGMYVQPPFYRELRKFDGSLVDRDFAKAQRSYQVVLGGDYKFKLWNRPFILTSEVYYKYLAHIIPYDVDNVRIRYYADQSAKGYATGLDIKINGEFVRGVDSWASLSLMRTAEDIQGDYYLVDANNNRLPFYNHRDDQVADTVFLGWHARPSNQLFSFSLFFQDYIPFFPTWRVNVTLTFGTGMPVNRSSSEFYEPITKYPPFRRVDIGFTKQLINEGTTFSKRNPFRFIKNMYISLEVFNILGINNTVSYTWVKDVSGISYGVNSYLTPRYVNLKLVMDF